MGVVSPNGVGLPDFKEALKSGKSGISFLKTGRPKLSLPIGGSPPVSRRNFKANLYGAGAKALYRYGRYLRYNSGYVSMA
ncbi:MAG: hypothetical protein U5L96_04565 [Owenweeksia sp.]|nr:hypothetical protein [Owenweeksia sp.]